MKLSRLMDILVSYNSDLFRKNTEGHEYYGFINGNVSVYIDEPKDPYYYTIYKNGEVDKFKKGDIVQLESMTVSDLPSDADYKIYSDIQVITAGYITFKSKTKAMDKKLITSLWDYYNEPDNKDGFKSSCYISFSKDYMKNISISVSSGIEIRILTVPELAILNCNLGYFEKKILPFIKSKNNDNAVYMFSTQLRAGLFSTPDKKKCSESVEAVINTASELYPDISIGYKPVNAKRIYL